MGKDDHEDVGQRAPSKASLPSSPFFRVSLGEGVTCIKAIKPPAIDDILAIGAMLAEAGDYPRRLWDYSSIEFPFSIDELRELGRAARQINRQNARIAVVVADDLGYGSMRVMAVHFENDTTSLGVFRDKQEAIHWLNKSSPDR